MTYPKKIRRERSEHLILPDKSTTDQRSGVVDKNHERKLIKITRDHHLQRYAEWERSSEQERRVDALALRADERRDKLRKASGRSKYPTIRRCLNGETRLRNPQASIRQSITYGGEPGELKHLSTRRKRKKHRFRK